ncbi:HAD family hydrolase [Niastella sp. OAS944]|uniref:HAD family hydrolase n=1 Tax=Niastella sp. OAS944 TaxID=2664089 RepID=UPI0034784388|nr:putative hydrolase of the HAD superfamily [Chitinophagaceae bacterium OAS944]
MAPVKNIIFDLGGVLLNLDVAQTRNAFIKLGLKQIDELFRIGHAEGFFKDYEVGAISDEEFVEKARQLSLPGTSSSQVIDAWNVMLLDFPAERVQFLDQLKNKYRLFLFSNTNAIHLKYFHKSYQDVYGRAMDDLFEKAYYSHVINHRKPDVAAFEYVINDSKLHAAETLFIDDALVNVEGARQAGLQAVHLTDGKTILDLGL